MSKNRVTIKSYILFLLIGLFISCSDNPDGIADITMFDQGNKLEWWREARFGMFIHWGVYAVPAGVYKGTGTQGNSEWIMLHRKIPVDIYKQYAKDFNPIKYDPDEWVRSAKEAGMKYIIITSKHHDGFALFDTKASDWNVVNATPYGKDLLKPLETACKKHGIKLGFYYSQAQDWTHPGGAARGGRWDNMQEGDMDSYIDQVAIPQVKELLSQYDIDVLWWDTPDGMTYELADRFLPLLKLKPNVITNNRLITVKHSDVPKDASLPEKYQGDFATAERHIPATGLDGDYENCQTMQRSWGYNRVDTNWKPASALIHNLVDNASKGGNYLLNVGPKADGTFPREAKERLKVIGEWMQSNGESIYGTTANPFSQTPWGKCTKKKLPDGNTRLYLHVFNWPKNGKLSVPGLKNNPFNLALLANRQELTFEYSDNELMIDLPSVPIDTVNTVIIVDVKGEVLPEDPLKTIK